MSAVNLGMGEDAPLFEVRHGSTCSVYGEQLLYKRATALLKGNWFLKRRSSQTIYVAHPQKKCACLLRTTKNGRQKEEVICILA
jgi:hypothetical protein